MFSPPASMRLGLVLFLSACLSACSDGGGGNGPPTAQTQSASTTVEWYALQLDLIRQTPGFSPPVASRALGYSGVALYESIVAGMPGYQSLAGQLNGLTAPPAATPGLSYHWGAVANAALAEITRRLYPVAPDALKQAIEDLEASQAAGFEAETDDATFARSVAHGRAVAAWIDDWSKNDGGRFGYLTNAAPGYVPPAGPGLWEPTPPALAPALQPFWGENRTFAIESGASCQPGPHPPFSTDPASEFFAEADEVYQTVQNLTQEQLDIALFWADNPGQTATPPGHWISIVNQILTRDDESLDVAAEAYAKVGIAVADAFISCWYAKYEQNLVRPITYIQDNIDAAFTTPVVTPPFPEYTSGHSVQSGAAATVLTTIFGEDFAFTDDTHDALGLEERSFSSFNEAAEEAAISRLYGGIHYRAAIDNGVEQGRAIGRIVDALSFRATPEAPPAGTPPSSFPATVATRWFDLSLDLVRTTPGFSPPVGSRALGYAGITLYEAVRPGLGGARSLAGQLNELGALPTPQPGLSYNWPAAANAALAEIFRLLFETTPDANRMAIDALEDELAATFTGDAATLERSVDFGRDLAAAVFFYSRSDGGHRGYLTNFPASYVPPAGPGLWVPTPPMFQSALQPFWGANRTFALEESAACDPGPPPPYSEAVGSVFRQEATEVHDTVNGITAEQLDIALWWADNPGQTATPPGHSISMLTIVLEDSGLPLDVAAEAYARVGIAVADAFVSCWEAKYEYNLVRPITYINDLIDPAWVTPVVTPPFPEYTSGHSVQSGAWAEVMTDLFGGSVAFTDDTNVFLGLAPRAFSSFFEAADEAAVSRLYGGIHFRSAIEIGVQHGRCVGQRVNELELR